MLRRLLMAVAVLGVAVAITGCGDNKPIVTSTTTPAGKEEGPPKPPPIPLPK